MRVPNWIASLIGEPKKAEDTIKQIALATEQKAKELYNKTWDELSFDEQRKVEDALGYPKEAKEEKKPCGKCKKQKCECVATKEDVEKKAHGEENIGLKKEKTNQEDNDTRKFECPSCETGLSKNQYAYSGEEGGPCPVCKYKGKFKEVKEASKKARIKQSAIRRTPFKQAAKESPEAKKRPPVVYDETGKNLPAKTKFQRGVEQDEVLRAPNAVPELVKLRNEILEGKSYIIAVNTEIKETVKVMKENADLPGATRLVENKIEELAGKFNEAGTRMQRFDDRMLGLLSKVKYEKIEGEYEYYESIPVKDTEGNVIRWESGKKLSEEKTNKIKAAIKKIDETYNQQIQDIMSKYNAQAEVKEIGTRIKEFQEWNWQDYSNKASLITIKASVVKKAGLMSFINGIISKVTNWLSGFDKLDQQMDELEGLI